MNAASFASAELPNGGLAQGGMFTLFGQNMGTGNVPQVLSFPLTTELDGVSVKITSGGTTVDCVMIYALTSQVACILPSNTPVGNGTLTVTARGATSAPLPVRIVAHSFGTFSINNAGSGPGIFTDNPYIGPNTLLHAGHAGEAWTIWGTGLGPITGPDNEAPAQTDMTNLNVGVLVGGANAQVIYRGRSAYAGIDQINFIIPANITGCYIPVAISVEGVTSNFTTMSLAGSGETCSETSGLLTSQNLQTAQQNGSLRAGFVGLSRVSSSFSIEGQSIDFNTEIGSGDFWSYNLDQLLRTQSLVQLSTNGACTVLQFRSSDSEFEDPIQGTDLDAGAALTVTGPNGAKTLPKVTEGGYFASLSSSGFPGLPLLSKIGGPVGQIPTTPPYLTPGAYTITGPGGTQVGAFSVGLTIPERLVWTNMDAITTVNRSQNLNITWTGGGASGYVEISGVSTAVTEDETSIGAIFFCRASAAAGSFSVPAAVLSALPASLVSDDFPGGLLWVGNSTDGETFTATGLDIGVASFSDVTQKFVGYE